MSGQNGEWMNEDQRSAVKADADAMTPADVAVAYMLGRIQEDPDLRHVMLHTEAFHKLCIAEASRKRFMAPGETAEQVETRRSMDRQPAHRKFKPRIPEFRRLIEAIANRVVEMRFSDDLLAELIDEAQRL